MKWMIASDIHGSALYCRQLFALFEKENADRLLLLGDLLYHGPRNDIPEGYDPKQVIKLLNANKEKIMCVRGNCDAEVDQMVLEFPIMADYALISVGEQRMIFATHGHIHNTESMPPLKNGDILLHGHTHIPASKEHNGILYFNPGSVSMPKNNTHHGIMILENETFIWKDLSGKEMDRYEL